MAAKSSALQVAGVCWSLQCVARSNSAVVSQREHVLRTSFEGDFADPAEIGGTADDDGRFSVADEILDFSALVSGVEWQENVACSQRCQVQHNRFDRFLHLHCDASTCRQIERLQQVGHHGSGAV
jgi:hypothetical protein